MSPPHSYFQGKKIVTLHIGKVQFTQEPKSQDLGKSHPSSGTECHWHFQQTGRCSLHFLTYDVTSLSHWLHRFTGASYWSDKIAPSSLIGRKAELQLCKNSISINFWNNVMVSMLRNIVTRLSSVWLWVFDSPGLGVGLLRQEGQNNWAPGLRGPVRTWYILPTVI